MPHILRFGPILVCLCLLLPACSSVPFNERVAGYPDQLAGASSRIAASMSTRGKVKGHPTYGAPIPLLGTTTWVTSFRISKEKWIIQDHDTFSEGGLASKNAQAIDRYAVPELIGRKIRWHDALFTDRATGEHWSLLQQRGFLSHWWTLVETTDTGPVTKLFVFAATIEDTNGDGTLDDRDASVAIVTDNDGRQGRVVTPPGAQLNSLRYYPDPGYLGFELRLNAESSTGTNMQFKENDPVRMYYLSLDGSMSESAPWQDPAFENRIEARYR